MVKLALRSVFAHYDIGLDSLLKKNLACSVHLTLLTAFKYNLEPTKNWK